MKRLLVLLLLATPLYAADYELGLRHVAAVMTGDSGDLDLPLSRGFAAFADVYWTKHLSTSAAATFVNPEAILRDEVDLGTLGLDVYSATARWHFAPDARLSAYAGAGAALVQIGNLDDQFGDAYEADFANETTFAIEGGVHYRIQRVVLELGVMYVPLEVEPRVHRATDPNIALPPKLGIDPVIVSIGAAWRFGAH
ncbi:MAG TPA: OmpW family outer membrane protein [Thermoanaerobaculia bacterium]|nr:OmpW family outer membrane protein [Thermoanaerobaculia bacterium]